MQTLITFVPFAVLEAYVVLIALPLILVAGLFIAGFVRDRLKKEKEEKAEEDKPQLDTLSEEDKKKLLEDYLAGVSQEKSGEEGEETLTETKKVDEDSSVEE